MDAHMNFGDSTFNEGRIIRLVAASSYISLRTKKQYSIMAVCSRPKIASRVISPIRLYNFGISA